MRRPINPKEAEWLTLLFGAEFKGKETVLKQLQSAVVEVKSGYDFYSIKFIVNGTYDRYPYKVRVPIEMRAYSEKKAPVIFLLHIINGTIDELEIFTADSSKLDVNNVFHERIEYSVDSKVKI